MLLLVLEALLKYTLFIFPSYSPHFPHQLLELKRNPQGVVDKRVRATLRPMSKNRRDSSVCELEQRLRDVKNTNCRFRKVLMEKENELQVLVRKLGPEARKWIDGITCSSAGSGSLGGAGDTEPILSGAEAVGGQNETSRLSVPPVRRDMPSTTGEIFSNLFLIFNQSTIKC